MTSLTFFTASRTPLPPNRLWSPSRSSTASCSPVDAPLGTAARPAAPLDRVTSASSVGLPRLSRISRARTAMIVLIVAPTLRGTKRGVNARLEGDDLRARPLAQGLAIVGRQPRRRERLADEQADRPGGQEAAAPRPGLEGAVGGHRDARDPSGGREGERRGLGRHQGAGAA